MHPYEPDIRCRPNKMQETKVGNRGGGKSGSILQVTPIWGKAKKMKKEKPMSKENNTNGEKGT